DVRRSADFRKKNLAAAFIEDTGTWAINTADGLQASAGSDAVDLFQVDSYVPNYFEVTASLQALSPGPGAKTNAYIVFDYQSPTDFKFAGLDVGSNKIMIGHRGPGNWNVDAQANFALAPGLFYDLFLGVNGVAVSVV